jgi:hypothetical protein
MMRDLKSMSRGGHVGVGGVQAWSAGDLFPWTIYTIEHYVPLTVRRGGVEQSTGVEDKSLADRFLWAEIRMSNPDGSDILLTTIMRGEDALVAHAKAQRAAEHALRTLRCLDTMELVLGYGQPKMAKQARREQIAELVNTTLARVKDEAEKAKVMAGQTFANTVMTTPTDKLGAMLFNNSEGYQECSEVDYFGGGACSGCKDAGTCGYADSTSPVCPLRGTYATPKESAVEARMMHMAAWGCT